MVTKSGFVSSGPKLFPGRGEYEFDFEFVNLLLKIKGEKDRRPIFLIFAVWIALLLGFTPCKDGQPLHDMKLHEKEAQKDSSIQEISLERTYS